MTIPAELTTIPQWCTYKLEQVNGRSTKVPYQTSGRMASSTNPNTWTSYDAAMDAVSGYNGLCFMLARENGIVFIDLDHSIREDGTIETWALEIVKRFDSYTERSQSGRGLHILIKGVKPGDRCRSGKCPHDVEIYSHSRQCCITGDILDGHDTIEERQDELDRLYREIFGVEEPTVSVLPPPTNLSDEEVIRKAMSAKNGKVFEALWNGSTAGYNGDDSSADMALADILAFWIGGDEARIERLFSQSGLGQRDKWRNRADYRKRTIQKAIADAREFYKPESNIPPNIEAKALGILRHGDPISYIADSCGRMALGAETAFKKLICCVSVQNVKQSAGLHPKLSGESSGGKTWTVYTFAHHLPPETVVKGSMSAKAGFYHSNGDRVFRVLDDYQAGNEDLDTVIKQTSSAFHEPYAHRTVANHKALTLTIGSEQTWAITSVDANQDVQVLNRQIPINVDDSIELTKKVNDRTIERYGKGEEQYPTDEQVFVSRAIFEILRADGYIDVRVPFWERIEWLDACNRRNPSIFMDLLVAHTAMNRHQREQDADGYYLATEEDFHAARALFTDKDGEELIKRLTKRERELIELLVSAGDTGLTRDEIAKKLGTTPNRVSQVVHGEKGSGGLTQKVQIAETRLSEMLKINDNQSRTVHKTVFTLTDYDRFAGFDGVVRLKPISEEPSKDGKHPVRNAVRIPNDSSKDSVSIVSKKEKERALTSVELIPSLEKPIQPYTPYAMAADSESKAYGMLTGCSRPYAMSNDSESKPYDFSDEELKLLTRIYGRMQHTGIEITPFTLATRMRYNDHDIGIDPCAEWLKTRSPNEC